VAGYSAVEVEDGDDVISTAQSSLFAPGIRPGILAATFRLRRSRVTTGPTGVSSVHRLPAALGIPTAAGAPA
jgi:hypothetical protein